MSAPPPPAPAPTAEEAREAFRRFRRLALLALALVGAGLVSGALALRSGAAGVAVFLTYALFFAGLGAYWAALKSRKVIVAYRRAALARTGGGEPGDRSSP